MSKIENTQEVAAAKAGMDIKTARKYLSNGNLPSEEKPERSWRTRPDPFESVRKEVEEQIDAHPGLEAKTIFEALQRKYPGDFADGQLRTLQRHLKRWRAVEGPGREVFFTQQHVPGRLDSTKRVSVKVDSGSVIYVERNVYSVHSRLIGEQVEARLSAETMEVWYAGQVVERLPRLRGRGKHRVDYRHIIDWLVRKPGAFDNYRYRDELFPTSRFRMAWDALRELVPVRANKRYLEILKLAAEEGEALVDGALRNLLEEGEIGEGKLNADALRQVLAEAHQGLPVTDIAVAEVALASFDELLGSNTVGVMQ